MQEFLNIKVFYTDEEFQAAKLEIKQEYDEKMENLLNREQQLKIKEEDFIRSASKTVKDLKTKNAEIIQGGFYSDSFLKISKS